ncbi:MAG: winged helix-turn-helix domain-containing protein [Pyrobaculum sp.]
MARGKYAPVLSHKGRQFLELLDKRGPLTVSQIAKELGTSLGATQWHLYVLEREGLIRRVEAGGVAVYTTRRHVGPFGL